MVCTIEKILSRYGTQMTLVHNGKSVAFQGFLQPFRSKSWQNMEVKYTPLGEGAAGQYVLLAPASLAPARDDVVKLGSRKLTVKRVETVMVGDEVAYYWGLCAE